MKVYDILSEDGRIVKGVNTTVDVGPNEIKIQSAKFGNTVDKDGVPPTLSKKVKGASTNVAFNIGLAEALELADRLDEGPIDWIKKKLIKLAGNYVLGKAEDTFVQLINDPDIKPILDNPELLKQRPEFKAASAQEKEEMIDAIIDLIQLRAQYKSNPNWKKQVMGNMGEGFDPVGWIKSSFNPDPQYKAWKKLFKQNPAQAKKMFRTNHRQYLAMYQNESISENSADSKDHIPYQDLIAQAINNKKMTFVNPNTGEEQSVMNPKHVGDPQKELEFKYSYGYPMTPQERSAIRPWVNIPGDKNLMRLPVTQMTMQQAVDWDMLGHPDMPQATIDAARKRYPNDPRVKNPTTYKLKSEGIEENFADGKKPGRKGLAKRSGVNTKASVSSLRKTAKNSSGEKQRMAHWLANMKAGKG